MLVSRGNSGMQFGFVPGLRFAYLILFYQSVVVGLIPPHARLDKLPPSARLFVLAGGRFFSRGYPVMAIYPLIMAGLVPLQKRFSHVNQSTHVLG